MCKTFSKGVGRKASEVGGGREEVEELGGAGIRVQAKNNRKFTHDRHGGRVFMTG